MSGLTGDAEVWPPPRRASRNDGPPLSCWAIFEAADDTRDSWCEDRVSLVRWSASPNFVPSLLILPLKRSLAEGGAVEAGA